MNIYVGNISYKTTEDSLRNLFGEKGAVDSVKIINDKFTGQSKGFAFVEMSADDEANKAILDLNGLDFEGRQIVVNKAHERKPQRSNNRY